MKARVERSRVITEGKSSSSTNPDHIASVNMSRVVSVESPDSRDGCTALGKTRIHYCTEGGRGGVQEMEGSSSGRIANSPMDALRMGMASPFRHFLGLLKPPPLPVGCSLHESPRASSMTAAEIEDLRSGSLKRTMSGDGGGEEDDSTGVEMSMVTSSGSGDGGASLVMVAFDANGKEVSHAGIVWVMEHVLKRGDILAVVCVLDSVRGPLGYKVKIGDQKWVSANQKLVEEEIQQKLAAWRNFPGLSSRCEEGGVKLVVMVKAAQRCELAVCREAIKLGACHVVLDKSLKNRRREFYLQNLSCDVTRMRRRGGVDVIRPSLDMAMMLGNLVQRNYTLPFGALERPSSPTSVIPPPLLSYGDQIDEFEITLGGRKPKRLNPKSAPLPSPKYSGKHSSSAYSGELTSSELRRLPSSPAVLASAYDRSGLLRSGSSSSVSAAISVQALSFTSSSHATDHDKDDDLFSIFHGSARHTDIDPNVLNSANINISISTHPPSTSSGYESDDLFSIGNVSTRRTPPLEFHHRQSLMRPGHYRAPSDTTTILRPNPGLSLDAYAPVISEPLREATISRIALVVGLGEAVTVSLPEALRPGEGLLVGSSPSALFLTHSDHHHATLRTATPGSYVAMEGKMAMKLAFLEPAQRVLAVDSLGRCRAVPVRHAATTTATPLVLVEAHCEGRHHSIMLHHTDTVALCHSHTHSHRPGEMGNMVSLKNLKVGHRVLLRLRSAEPSHAIWSS